MSLKTLHLTNSWHEKSGGIATFYRALIEAANRRGHHIRLVVPAERSRVEEAGELGRIYHVAAPRAPFNAHYRIIYPTHYPSAGSELQKILIAERPDLVEICDKYTLNYLGAVLRRRLLPGLDFRPVVIGLSCERMDDNFRSYIGNIALARNFCAAYVKWIYFPFFDHHIANSLYTAEELRSAARGHITSRNTWIRPMGVHLERLSPSHRSPQMRQKILRICGGGENSVVLIYAGRLAPEKNPELLFRLLVHLNQEAGGRDYRLLVAGEGIEKQRWEEFCNKRVPGRAVFWGHVADPAELADLVANADAFIHPNPREPFGIGPLEAMASGLPLVAPNTGGVTTYASDQNAWLAPPDVASFAAAVKDLVENEALRISRTENALQTAQQYRWEAVASSFLDLYGELCAASATESEVLPPPDFSSEGATGRTLVWSRRISHAVEWNFQRISSFLDRPGFPSSISKSIRRLW